MKTDSTAYTQQLIGQLKTILPAKFGEQVRIEFGGDFAEIERNSRS
jgi:hypothetical protein